MSHHINNIRRALSAGRWQDAAFVFCGTIMLAVNVAIVAALVRS